MSNSRSTLPVAQPNRAEADDFHGTGGPHVPLRRRTPPPADDAGTDLAADDTAAFVAPLVVEPLAPNPIDARASADSPVPLASQFQLVAQGIQKRYRKGNVEIPVLRGVNLSVRQGEFLAIVGHSGSGKSTLLHLLATLDAPDKGVIYFNGQRIDHLVGRQRDALRNRHLGMIFQFYHLLPELTTLENVLSPIMIRESAWGYFARRGRHRARAKELLEMVGLSHRLKHTPRELSGGEMQRAAIARALIAGPELLLADEPTGNLDRDNGREILELLLSLNRREKLTIVMVTHDPTIASLADRTVRLAGGVVEGEERSGDGRVASGE